MNACVDQRPGRCNVLARWQKDVNDIQSLLSEHRFEAAVDRRDRVALPKLSPPSGALVAHRNQPRLGEGAQRASMPVCDVSGAEKPDSQ